MHKFLWCVMTIKMINMFLRHHQCYCNYFKKASLLVFSTGFLFMARIDANKCSLKCTAIDKLRFYELHIWKIILSSILLCLYPHVIECVELRI